jgi:glycosyltransferase involved in cell wall biosynthesis
MRKLIIFPGACDALGGTLVTLCLLIKGFEENGASEALYVLVQADSIMEKYLQAAGQEAYLVRIPAENKAEYWRKALQWVNRQPKNYPLLLDNCVERSLLLALLVESPKIRLSGRPVYHFFHDLALSYNYAGYLLRKLSFGIIAPKAICNSQFTAQHIRHFIGNPSAIMYQPVDTKSFNDRISTNPPPLLEPILRSGAKIILTPSRINQPGTVNDKNLRALIPVLAHLKANGHFYHSVVIGQDSSPGKIRTQALLDDAKQADVRDRFTILPPDFAIEDYYKYADVVVTLAPREPFGRTVVEAVACGVPVVGSNTGGINEILQNFAPHWTVNTSDSSAIAETIIQVVNSSSSLDFIKQGKDWIDKNCSINDYALRIIQITGLMQHKKFTSKVSI